MAECWVASGTKASGSLDTLNRWSLPQFQTRSSDLAYASNPLEQIRVKRRKELHDLFSSRFGQTTPLSRSLRWRKVEQQIISSPLEIKRPEAGISLGYEGLRTADLTMNTSAKETAERARDAPCSRSTATSGERGVGTCCVDRGPSPGPWTSNQGTRTFSYMSIFEELLTSIRHPHPSVSE